MNIDTFYYLDAIRNIVMPLPGAEEYTCFGTTAFRVKKKLLARMKEDGKTLVIRSEERDVWMKKDSSVFFITEHYRNYPSILVNLAAVKPADLKQLLLDGYRRTATKRLLKEMEDMQQRG